MTEIDAKARVKLMFPKAQVSFWFCETAQTYVSTVIRKGEHDLFESGRHPEIVLKRLQALVEV